eukprot:CAMPEP_0181243262 /NCGR_PEP_ID=MMETSP1096-20121128/42170_1 /TAXON_ID=156174 ORGANISM="Chrysochromulina ericina, Strain CCMP281" /NCGR_SAMPLE_ID=MMETSP1096 /ASSEMBLY_ACC=CAM_ASM_000453 /LENGTH=316 /DNA_ID=CAMNT_0023339607 /DNA_START=30 /DNA_END=980 /DNA_ORIENTATION=-
MTPRSHDELVTLVATGTHYVVFWSPGDQILGPPTHTAKFGVVLGDKGQSEEFSGPTLDVGECALPAPDYYENECKHGYGAPPDDPASRLLTPRTGVRPLPRDRDPKPLRVQQRAARRHRLRLNLPQSRRQLRRGHERLRHRGRRGNVCRDVLLAVVWWGQRVPAALRAVGSRPTKPRTPPHPTPPAAFSSGRLTPTQPARSNAPETTRSITTTRPANLRCPTPPPAAAPSPRASLTRPPSIARASRDVVEWGRGGDAGMGSRGNMIPQSRGNMIPQSWGPSGGYPQPLRDKESSDGGEPRTKEGSSLGGAACVSAS